MLLQRHPKGTRQQVLPTMPGRGPFAGETFRTSQDWSASSWGRVEDIKSLSGNTSHELFE